MQNHLNSSDEVSSYFCHDSHIKWFQKCSTYRRTQSNQGELAEYCKRIINCFQSFSQSLKHNPNIRNIQNTYQMVVQSIHSEDNQDAKNYFCAMACVLGYSNILKQNSQLQVELLKMKNEALRIFGVQRCEQIEDSMQVSITHGYVIFHSVIKEKSVQILRVKRKRLSESIQTFKRFLHTKTYLNYLFQIMIAYGSKRTVLIQGQSCSGKTSLCLESARLINSPYILVPMHRDMEVKDLIGGISPTQEFRSPLINEKTGQAELDIQIYTDIVIQLNCTRTCKKYLKLFRFLALCLSLDFDKSRQIFPNSLYQCPAQSLVFHVFRIKQQ